MYLCICNEVTDSQIKQLIESGMSVAEIQNITNAGTKCGKCLRYIEELYKVGVPKQQRERTVNP